MASTLFPLVLALTSMLVGGDRWDCVDYYWRDYYGVISNDAVPAGQDCNDNTLYIGTVYIKNAGFFPCTIYPRTETIRTVVDNTVYDTDQYVKILCYTHREAFKWIPVDSEDLNVHVSGNGRAIPGGSKINEQLYIGRVVQDKSVIIGEVFRHESSKRGIWFSSSSNSVSNQLSYEILTFNCEAGVHSESDRLKNDPENENDIILD